MVLKSVLAGLNLNWLGVLSLLLAFAGFVAVLVWTFTRPREQIEAESRLWMDDEK